MTKVSVFGEQPTEAKEFKKIEFAHRINSSGHITEAKTGPCHWENVMLYRKGGGFYDIILAFDNGEKAIFLGHWNDGVV